jgi:hypothetical protein
MSELDDQMFMMRTDLFQILCGLQRYRVHDLSGRSRCFRL